jgi:hypothetical protein
METNKFQLFIVDDDNIMAQGLEKHISKKFGNILDLIPYCDKVTKLTSLCSICKNGTLAIFSLRITDDEVDRKQSSPPINISYDFASRSKFTLGIALYYENFQFFKPNPNASVFLNRNKNLAFSGDLSKKDISFNLINPSIRLLYHKIKNDNDLYAGVRVGYDIFTNVSLPNPKFSKLIKNKSTTQLLMGYRKYVNNWGFNIEGAVGRPFWFLGGVNYKIIKK